ncbi:MAG: histidinol dehydrogenase [Verrucomicrobiota bacterium]|nr:histidinol dehydrogenase [Verrucomicrobiota bacterium]
MIRIIEATDARELLARKCVRLTEAEAVVRPILANVRARGDEAVLDYARHFDRFDRDSLLVTEQELSAAADALSPTFRDAVETASANIHAFAELQLPSAKSIELTSGLRVGQIVRPLETVCAYVPGGRYPLPSTVMMTVIPAQVAGVPNICITTPKPSLEILGTAALLGSVRVFLIGGAHAIAAFAFGTESIPHADRIVGPGNIYVAAAKKLLAGEVGIDFIAGPTEIVIIANEGEAAWIAGDMLAQAEHDSDASAILLTTSRALADRVSAEIEKQLETLSTAETAREAIRRNSAIVLVRSEEEAVEISNNLAPEHLSIHDASLLPHIRHAGSVFIGPCSPEAAGDYASGPNHVLPTSGAARVRGGLSAADFVKVISTQEFTGEALNRLAPTITVLARAEGLEAHARSVAVRFTGSGGMIPPFRTRDPLPPRQAVQRMTPYSPPTGGRADKLRLDFNENTVGCSPQVAAFLRSRITEGLIAVYPEYSEAKRDLAAHFGVDETGMLLTNGTDEAIQVLINTFVDHDDEVLILQPSYAMYRFYAELAGAAIREIPYRAETLAFPLEELFSAITPRTRAILISNPNNPTGTAVQLDVIEQILARAPQAAVLIDEAYFEFFGTTALPLIGRHPNLFVTRTFSKTYGMASMRLGCLFSDPGNVALMRKAQSPYSVNMLAALAARVAIADREFINSYVREILSARNELYAGLERLRIPFHRSEGNFVLVRFGDRAAEISALLREKGVLVRDRSYELAGCVRVTVGTREQTARFLSELERIWR